MIEALYIIPFLALFVALLIRAEILNIRRQIYVLKPISTVLVIVVLALSFQEPSFNPMYSIGVLIGLILSFGGDMVLMFPENRRAFMLGLTLFLLAHIAYAIIFVLMGRFSAWDTLTTIVLLSAGVGFYRLIRSNLGSMRTPVILYIVVISFMVSRAFSSLVSPRFDLTQGIMITIGALLFYISDLMLAGNRFWRPWRYHRISLAFYYSGQLLLALTASYFV
jgi:uncharacterized membrane protein YhhN